MVNGVTNYNRVSGLVSGMDIDGIVKKLMDAERIPLNRVQASKQKLLWKQEAIRNLNLEIKKFTDGTSAMRLQGTFGMFTMSSTDSSVVTGVGTSSGSDSVAQFKNISALATSASTATSTVGGVDGNSTTKINPNAILNTIATPGGAASSGKILIKALQKDGSFKSVSVTYDVTTDTLTSVLNKINTSGAGVTAFYDSGSDKVIVSNNATGKGNAVDGAALQIVDDSLSGGNLVSKLGLGDADGSDAYFVLNGVGTSRQSNTFTVNGISYTLLKTTGTAASTTSSAAIGTAIDPTLKLNTQTFATGFSAATGNFDITALQPDGTMKTVNISYDTANDSLNDVLTRINSAGLNVTASIDPSTNKVTMKNNINGKGTSGVALRFTDNTGNMAKGVLQLSDAEGVDSNTVNVEAKRDVDGLVTKIKDFLDKYNSMLDTLNNKYNEPTYRDFQPLTDDQKINMKDDDIKKWEDKAKSGLLARDSTLGTSITNLRNDAYSTVAGLPTGAIDQLVDIGITTDLYTSNGKLIIKDETKLRNALTQNPDQVMKLFTNYDSTDSTKNGIAWKLYNRANDTITSFTKTAGSGTTTFDDSQLSKDISKLNLQINDWNVKLNNKENAYYAKFTAMETAMSRLQQQSASLISQMGGR